MRRTVALASLVAVIVGGLVAAAPAQAVPPGCYRPVYTHHVYRFTAADTDPESLTRLTALTPAQFQEQCAGSATVVRDDQVSKPFDRLLNGYYQYTFLPDIVGQTTYTTSGPLSDDTVPYDLWVQDGSPRPSIAANAQDLVYTLSSDPSAIYLVVGDNAHHLTFAQWNSLYHPTPKTIGAVERYPFDTALWFVADGDDGSPVASSYLDAARWASLDFPAPAAASALPGDLVYRFAGESAVYLRDPAGDVRHLTYGEWTSIGQRPPVVYAPTDAPPTAATTPGTPSGAAAEVGGLLDRH